MHHDSRTYIELRYDESSCDVVVVTFRDRGILPTETLSHEFSMEGPDFTGDSKEEVRSCLWKALQELHHNW